MGMCSIKNCKNQHSKGNLLRFFRFPKNESIANEWLRYCKPTATQKNGRVCSDHFLPSDYFKSLKHTLLNDLPQGTRTLKPDAVPSLGIDKNIICFPDKCNPTKDNNDKDAASFTKDVGSSNVISKQNDLSELKTSKVECQLKPSNNVPGSLEDVEESAVRLKEIKLPRIKTTEVNYDMKPLKEIGGSLKDVAKGAVTHKHIQIPRPKSSDMECETTPHKEIKWCKSMEDIKKCDQKNVLVVVPLEEHKKIQKKLEKFEVLKNNLRKIFTPGQVRCLMKPNSNRRVMWTAEDIAAAMSLRKISPTGYLHLKDTVGMPLPSLTTLRNWYRRRDKDNRK